MNARRPGPRFLLIACVVLAVPLQPSSGAAADGWKPDGSPVCTAPGDQLDPILVRPGTAVWNDRRYDRSSIFCSIGALHARWDESIELPVYTGPGDASAPRAAPFADGALVAWSDTRNGPDNADVFVQRIGGSGVWPSYLPDGIPVCEAPGNQVDPSIADDGAGGFYVAWSDARNDSTAGADIYLQHVHEYGQVWEGWAAGGLRICGAPGGQGQPVVVADGSGGALVFWVDNRAGWPAIFGIGVGPDAEAAPGWNSGGNAICFAGGFPWQLRVLPDGAGGAYLAWLDARSGTTQIFASRVSRDGTPGTGWPTGGIPVSDNPQETLSAVAFCAADSGGIYLAWTYRGKGLPGLRVQRIQGDGNPGAGWPPGGLIVSEGSVPQAGVAAAPAGGGGVFVAWNDYGNSIDVRAQRLGVDGAVAEGWPAGGVVLSGAGGHQMLPGWRSGQPPGGAIMSDGDGGVIVAWMDSRNPERLDIYAQRVTGKGIVAPAYPPFCIECVPDFIERVYPNPARGAITVRAWVSEDGGAWIEVVDIRGVVRRSQHDAQPGPLYRSIPVDLQGLPAGVYFLQYRTRSTEAAPVYGRRRIVLVH